MLRYCRPVVVIAGTSFEAESFGSPPDDFGPPDGIFTAFIVLFVVVFVAMIGFSIWSIVATRKMAKRRGASDADATTLALFGGETGTAVAYAVKDARPAPVVGPVEQSSTAVEQRIREVRELEAKGLITAEQATARVDEILRSV